MTQTTPPFVVADAYTATTTATLPDSHSKASPYLITAIIILAAAILYVFLARRKSN